MCCHVLLYSQSSLMPKPLSENLNLFQKESGYKTTVGDVYQLMTVSLFPWTLSVVIAFKHLLYTHSRTM